MCAPFVRSESVSRSNTLSRVPFEATIDGLTHDGRGVARREGKAVFVRGALPGERVMAQPTARHRNYDEASVVEKEIEALTSRQLAFGVLGFQALRPAALL